MVGGLVGGQQGASVRRPSGEQGRIDGLSLNAAHLEAAQQQAQCDCLPLLPLYEIKRTFITVPDPPFTPKSAPGALTGIKPLSVRC